LSKELPRLTDTDAAYCKNHYDSIYELDTNKDVSFALPIKFAQLLTKSQEIKDIWQNVSEDRSKSDYRLGHLLLSHGFTKEESLSVLVNVPKALERTPNNRYAYASNIVEKVYPPEMPVSDIEIMSQSMGEILSAANGEELLGERIYGNMYFDNTSRGLRRGDVFGHGVAHGFY